MMEKRNRNMHTNFIGFTRAVHQQGLDITYSFVYLVVNK